MINNYSLHNQLSSLGDCWSINVHSNLVDEALSLYSSNNNLWSTYGEDPSIPRQALPLMSLNGDYEPIPNLRSLGKYNEKNKTNLKESSFNKPTAALIKSKQLYKFSKQFDNCGRINAFKVNKGGFFPPHRDGAGLISRDTNLDTFRLILPLDNFGADNSIFLLDKKICYMQCGYMYFLNTLKSHALFSFHSSTKFILFSIPLTKSNVTTTISMREDR